VCHRGSFLVSVTNANTSVTERAIVMLLSTSIAQPSSRLPAF
jgi:hypothetical protein